MGETAVRSVSVRVDKGTYERVRRLAAQDDRSITEVIAQVVREAEERRFWRAHQDGVARLKADPEAWQSYLDESRELEGTLGDGVEPDEDWAWLKEAVDAGHLHLEQPEDRSGAP